MSAEISQLRSPPAPFAGKFRMYPLPYYSFQFFSSTCSCNLRIDFAPGKWPGPYSVCGYEWARFFRRFARALRAYIAAPGLSLG